ncbi:hypothetical protein [Reyranella soli]|uniref:Uncharacterized protein n=1 Tax=Reyranella soli TaxID=1230389 RepID=A0A512NJ82_9HYPH|nr:hypothetical protein [Reyranella soli]GEP59011.1 hypothetical protein RSO01_61770 [Reyranella soli]
MPMHLTILDLYRVKPEFMPPDLQRYQVYVRPGELEKYADPAKWDYVGRTFHPNRLQAGDVMRQGYCERKIRAGIDLEKMAKLFYTHPTSIAARERQHAS